MSIEYLPPDSELDRLYDQRRITMSDKHTPVPWYCRQAPDSNQEWWIDAPGGDPDLHHNRWDMMAVVYGCDDQPNDGATKAKANARFIVKACNHHAELVEALRDCSDELAEAIEGKYHGILGYPSTDRDYRTDMAVVDRARAIIAKLEANQ